MTLRKMQDLLSGRWRWWRWRWWLLLFLQSCYILLNTTYQLSGIMDEVSRRRVWVFEEARRTTQHCSASRSWAEVRGSAHLDVPSFQPSSIVSCPYTRAQSHAPTVCAYSVPTSSCSAMALSKLLMDRYRLYQEHIQDSERSQLVFSHPSRPLHHELE